MRLPHLIKMKFPGDVWIIIISYKKEFERVDAFNHFLTTVFENLIAAMKSK